MPTDRISSLDTNRIAKIMTAALEEFAKYPYNQASYNRIIKASGISKGTMYYYFKSKEDVFQTLLLASRREFVSLAPNLKELTTADHFWQALGESMTQFFQLLETKPITGKFIVSLLRQDQRESAHPAKEAIVAVESWVEELVLHGQLLGALRRDLDIDLTISLAWSIWQTLTRWWQASLGEQPVKTVANMTLQQLKRSFAPEASSQVMVDTSYVHGDREQIIQP